MGLGQPCQGEDSGWLVRAEKWMKDRMESEEQTSGSAEVRQARADDMDALLTIERQCFNVYYYDYYMLDRRDFEFYLADRDSLILVAAREGQVVGGVLGPVDTWREPPSAHIDSIAVLPGHQRQGIGAQLLQSFLTEVRRRGCVRVTLEVSTANAKGLAFFAKHGFRQERKLRDYYGKGLPALFMAVELG
jgi:ribosomal-protein-alanine N-acetyltransferase